MLPRPLLQPNMMLRGLVHDIYGSSFPLEPGGCFPRYVSDPGALPTVPYDFAFWGFSCSEFSGLQRNATPHSINASVDTLLHGLELLRANPPR